MNIPLNIPFNKIKQRFPKQVKAAVQNFSKAKKPITTDPSTWKYSLDWCVRFTSYSYQDIISGKAQQDGMVEDAKSIDQKVNDYGSRCSVNLKIQTAPRRFVYESLNHTPQEILDDYRNTLLEDEKEKRHFNKLSPQERQKELNDNLKELSKYPGFSMFSIGR